MSRYTSSRGYWTAGIAGFAGSLFSAWVGLEWPLAFVPAVLLLMSATLLTLLATRPPIEIRRTHMVVGEREIPWETVRRVDRTGWSSPLVVRLTLGDESRLLVVFAGDPPACRTLLSQILRLSREALIDNVPHPQFWGESPGSRHAAHLASPRYPVLCPEDEAEVERLYQRLKTVGHIDPKSSDEK